MRIAVVNELFYPRVAGTEKRLFEIGRRLVKRGHEVHVFTMQYDKELKRDDVIDGIQVHRYAHSRNYTKPTYYRSLTGVSKYSFSTFFRLLFNRDFDIYYFGQWPVLHSLASRPLISAFVQEWCEVWSEKIAFLQRLHGRVIDFHVAVSDFTKRRMVEQLHIDPKKMTVIHNGVDYNKLSQGSHNKRWGRLAYVGRLLPHKNVEVAIEAYRLVKEKFPEAELHIVGDGPLLPEIKKRASRLKDCHVDKSLDVLGLHLRICSVPHLQRHVQACRLRRVPCSTPTLKCLLASVQRGSVAE